MISSLREENNWKNKEMEDGSHRSHADADPADIDGSFFGNEEISVVSEAFEKDPMQDLEKSFPMDTSRLTLKWEPSTGDSHSKIIVGSNTYLPLDVGRSCYSIEIPQQPLSSSKEPNNIQLEKESTRMILCRLVSKIVVRSPRIRQLDLEGFGRRSEDSSNGQDSGTTVDIEDIFEAFAGDEFSPWRRGSLAVLRTWNCDMNSTKGNRTFDLAEDEYPEGLEEVYVHNPKGSVLSSSIFKISSRSKRLGRLYVFDGSDGNDISNSIDEDAISIERANNNIHYHPQHKFNGSRLTRSSIDALCEVLSATNRLRELNQLPFRELLQLPDIEFGKLLEATMKTHNSSRRIPNPPDSKQTTNLRFPIVPPIMVSKLIILASRAEALRFYLLWKRSLEVLRNPSTRNLAPRVLQKCQKRKSIPRYIPYSNNDLIYAMLQDSLQCILEERRHCR